MTTTSAPLRVPLLSGAGREVRDAHTEDARGNFIDVPIAEEENGKSPPPPQHDPKKLAFETEDDAAGEPRKERGFFDIYRFATKAEMCAVVLGILVALANGTIQPLQAVLMGRIFGGQAGLDTTVLNDNIHDNMKYLLLAALISFILNYVQVVCFVVTAERVTRRMKQACFESLLRQEVAFFDMHASGTLAHRIEEQSMFITRGISDPFGTGVQFASQFISGFAISFSRNAKVATAMVIFMPLITIFLGGLIFSMVKFMRKSSTEYEDASSIAQEALAAPQTVWSLNAEHIASARYDEKLTRAERAGLQLAFWRSVGLGLVFSTIFLTFGVGYWYGAQLIAKGGEDIGGIFTSVFSAVLGSIAFGLAAPNLGATAHARVGSNVLFKLIERRPRVADAPSRGNAADWEMRGRIEFKNVDFAYPTRMDTPVFRNLNFTVEEGTTCAFVGESGCGKSTVVSLIERFYDPQNGSVMIDGRDIRTLDVRWYRSKLGLVSQEPVLYDTSIADNIRIGKPGATMEEVVACAKAADAHEFISSLPMGYATRVGGGGSQLSVGQKQKVSVARALVKEPVVLLLDEATSALDERSQRSVQMAIDRLLFHDEEESGAGGLIRDRRRKMTTIVVAHRLSTIRNANMIIVLRPGGGGIAQIGTHDQLMADEEGIYYRLNKAQESTKTAMREEFEPVETSFTGGNAENNFPNDKQGEESAMIQRASSEAFDLFTSTSGMNASPSLQGVMRGSSISASASNLSLASMSSSKSRRSKPGAASNVAETRERNRSSLLFCCDGDESSPEMVMEREPDEAEIVEGEEEWNERERLTIGSKLGVLVGKEPKNHAEEVPVARLLALSRPESKWFISGFLGSAVKGSAQPLLSLVLSHVMSHMILIPDRVDGFSPFRCEGSADCGRAHPLCLIRPGGNGKGFCVASCGGNADCATGHACVNLASLGLGGGVCVPPGGWLDGHSPDDVRHTGAIALAAYAGVGLISALGMAFQSFSFGLIGERLTTRLRSALFSAMLARDAAFFDAPRNEVGALSGRLSTEAAIVKTVTCEYSGLLVESVVAVIVACSIAFWSSWRMASVMLLVSPFLALSTYYQQRALIGKNRLSDDRHRSAAGILGEAITNIRTVYSFNAESRILGLYSDALEIPYRAGVKNAHITGIGSGVAQALFFLTYAAGFAFGAHLLSRHEIDARRMSRSFFAMTLTATTLGQSISRTSDWVKAKAAILAIFKLVDGRAKINGSRPPPGKPAPPRGPLAAERGGVKIEFTNVAFRYPTRPEYPVLNSISFKIERGTNVAFVGRSGCGKSSIVRLLLRFYDVDEGKITIDDVSDLRTMDVKEWRRRTGLVGQEPVLFRGSVRFNLSLGNPSASEAEMMSALASANAQDFVLTKLPAGLDTDVGNKGNYLSGGERQRIALARALLKSPSLLLLDEATSALDNESEKIVQAALDRLMGEGNRTTIVIAHRLSTVRGCDQIFVMANDEGTGARVVERGKHEELLMKKDGIYAELYRMSGGGGESTGV